MEMSDSLCQCQITGQRRTETKQDHIRVSERRTRRCRCEGGKEGPGRRCVLKEREKRVKEKQTELPQRTGESSLSLWCCIDATVVLVFQDYLFASEISCLSSQ